MHIVIPRAITEKKNYIQRYSKKKLNKLNGLIKNVQITQRKTGKKEKNKEHRGKNKKKNKMTDPKHINDHFKNKWSNNLTKRWRL